MVRSDHNSSRVQNKDTKNNHVKKILIIDDNPAIHEDVRKILHSLKNDNAHEDVFNAFLCDETKGEETSSPTHSTAAVSDDRPPSEFFEFVIDSAYQGQEGYQMAQQALAQGDPYSLALVDMRMPPGWDGLETTINLFKLSTDLQVIICTAFSDYSFSDIVDQLGFSQRFLILKKPYDPIEVIQGVCNLVEKFRLNQETAQYLNALTVSNENLAQAVTSRDRFLTNMTHELKTPLHWILSYAHFGRRRGPQTTDEEITGWFNDIHDSAQRLDHLTSDVLTLTRIESGQTSFNLQEAPLNEVVEDVLRAVEDQLREKNLKTTYSSITTQAHYDREHLSTALKHLYSNAIKFAHPHSTIHLTVDVAAAPSHVHLSLTNQGPPIPPEDRQHIFEIFSESSETRNNAGGLGLGLSLCRAIISAHGGQIEVTPSPPGTTTISFTLPRQSTEKPSSQRTA